MHAEVAVAHAKKVLELVEGERSVHGERADDRQTGALVNEAIEMRQLALQREGR